MSRFRVRFVAIRYDERVNVWLAALVAADAERERNFFVECGARSVTWSVLLFEKEKSQASWKQSQSVVKKRREKVVKKRVDHVV